MAAGLKKGDRITAFVDRVEGELVALDGNSMSAREVVRHKLEVVLRYCGYERISTKALERIQAALVARGIYPQPTLTEPGLGRSKPIYFGRVEPTAPPQPRSQMFDLEHDLERFMKANFESLEQFKGLKLVKTQFELPELKRADLIARETSSKKLVLIELKNDDGDARLVAQLRGYVDAIRTHGDMTDEKLRVIVVTGQPNAVLKQYLVDLLGDRATVEWYVYEVNLTLHPV